jgi:hypothetical protein
VKLWQRRAVRQMVVSVLPLVVVCVALTIVLVVRANSLIRQVAPATARAQATVAADGVGRDGLDLDWTDAAGHPHRSRLVFPQTQKIGKGTPLEVAYDPADPTLVHAGGDAVDVQLRNLESGVLFALLVLVVGLLTTAFRLWRRVAAERRQAHTYPVRRAQYRRGLIRRSWLVIADAQREWWVPVYWQPGLATLMAGTPCRVHGNPALDRLLVVEVDGIPVWPAGRRRPDRPKTKGEWLESAQKWTKGAQKQRERDGGAPVERVALARHLGGDVALVLPAPVLGILWAYIDGSGAGGFAIATALVACVLFWLPGVFGSDPT